MNYACIEMYFNTSRGLHQVLIPWDADDAPGRAQKSAI